MCGAVQSTENCVRSRQVLESFFPDYADMTLKFSFQGFRTAHISIYSLKGGKNYPDCNCDVWASKHGLAF